MKKLLITLAAIALAVSAVSAQRSVPPKTSFRDYRPDGEFRLWTFMKKDSTIGRLNSVAVRAEQIDGAEAYRVQAQLSLDYTRADGNLILNVTGENFFYADGAFAGCDITRKVNDQQGKVSLRRQGGKLVGSVERGSNSTPQEIAFPRDGFAIDYDLPDQYELYFAMHGIKVGDVIDDSIFVPTDLGVTYLRGRVTGWTWQQLWQGVFDSVFVVEMVAPVPQELFINKDLWLRKINIPNQDMRVYLDAVRAPATKPGTAATEVPATTTSKLPERPPTSGERTPPGLSLTNLVRNFIVYLVVGFIGVIMFMGRLYRRSVPYIGALAGILVTVLIWVIVSIFSLWSDILMTLLYLPSAMYFLILWALLVWLRSVYKLHGSQVLALGATIGAGIGIAIAGSIDIVSNLGQPLWFSQLLDLLFMVGGGALLGWAVARSVGVAVVVYVVVSVISAVLANLPPTGFDTLMVGFAAVLLLLAALILSRRDQNPAR